MPANFWDDVGSGWAETVTDAAKPTLAKTREEFEATVKPEMLDAQGKFKAPKEGVNFMLEGLTPAEAYQTAQGILSAGDWSEDNRLGKPHSKEQADAILDTGWRTGPNNGGGILGGLGNAAQGMFDGVRTNPAIMAALTAGAGNYINSGLQGAGMSAGTAKAVTPLISNAAKTAISGGSVGDMVKSAAGSYAGGQASEAMGGGTLGQIGGNVVSSLVSGKDPLKALVSAGATAAAGEITGSIDGFDELSEAQQTMINGVVAKTLQGKNPTQALIDQVKTMAMGEVSKASKPKIQTGGWAA